MPDNGVNSMVLTPAIDIIKPMSNSLPPNSTILNGKMYRCPFSANAHNINAIPYAKEDVIDLLDESIDKIHMKEKILTVRTWSIMKVSGSKLEVLSFLGNSMQIMEINKNFKQN